PASAWRSSIRCISTTSARDTKASQTERLRREASRITQYVSRPTTTTSWDLDCAIALRIDS
ncbi:hypothetical protein LTR16_007184, partial [Cryomyces antarcticus]